MKQGKKEQKAERSREEMGAQMAPEAQKPHEEKLAGDIMSEEGGRPVPAPSEEMGAQGEEPGAEAEGAARPARKPVKRGRSTARKSAPPRARVRGPAPVGRKAAKGSKAKGGMAQKSPAKRQARARSSKRHGD